MEPSPVLHPLTVRLPIVELEALEKARKVKIRSRSGQIARYVRRGLENDGFLAPRNEAEAGNACQG